MEGDTTLNLAIRTTTQPGLSALPRPAARAGQQAPADQATLSRPAAILGGAALAGIYTGAMGYALTAGAAFVASAVGLPFAGPAAQAVAVGVAGVVGAGFGAITGSLASKPLPENVQEDFASARTGVHHFLPNLRRDKASLALAVHASRDALARASQAPSHSEAAREGRAAVGRLAELFGHGAARLSGLVLGWSVGMGATGSVLGGVAGAALMGVVLDQPGHLLGQAAGAVVGSATGAAARAMAD